MFNKTKIFLFSLTLFLFAFPSVVNAQPLINEISVMPTDKYDWVEVYSPDVVDITGWKLADETGEYYTFPTGSLLGPGTFLVVPKVGQR
jgi:hypothetical protein